MSKQYNKGLARKRRMAYIKRKKAAVKAKSASKAAPAAA